MKRYRSSTRHEPLKEDPINKYMAMIVPHMAEDLNGEWVKWEDVKGILQYKDQLKGYKLEAEGLKCNCEYESERREGFSSEELLSWICPAHGYKRR